MNPKPVSPTAGTEKTCLFGPTAQSCRLHALICAKDMVNSAIESSKTPVSPRKFVCVKQRQTILRSFSPSDPFATYRASFGKWRQGTLSSAFQKALPSTAATETEQFRCYAVFIQTNQAPAKPGAYISFKSASYRQLSQEAPNNRLLHRFSKINFLPIVKGAVLFSLRSMLEVKRFLLSPSRAGGLYR